DWIRINSTDGYSYIVRRKVANMSGTIKSMLDPESNYAEAATKTCEIHQRGIITEKLVEYMAFKAHYETLGPKEEVPVTEYTERLPLEITLELFVVPYSLIER
ncbi:hypothetical protein BDQ17DRAFT_1250134, partial [Cyathus striatus]